MKPYQYINCILQQIFSNTFPFETEYLVFEDNLRWRWKESNVDNLWHAKFFSLSKEKYFDYYDNIWINYDDNKTFRGSNITGQRILPHVIDHSYEPIDTILDEEFWDPIYKYKRLWPRSDFSEPPNYVYDKYKPKDYPLFVLHSEKNSKDIEKLEQWTYIPLYWFSHAYLCSEFYFKHYKKLNLVTQYKSRPIEYKWFSANRLLRSHRTDLLEQLDLSQGCYSLANPDPNGLRYTGPVPAHSFDTHENHSAEICIDKLTPWNTSFLHVVNETVWQDKIHFTEKIFKPIVMHQPFVVVQAPGSLKYLQSYGFKTFGDWWDESYDDIEDPTQRLQAIAKIINDIGGKDINELEKLRMEMAGVLEHNFHHFYENIPAIVLGELENNIRLLS
jgi:hypothetical protein